MSSRRVLTGVTLVVLLLVLAAMAVYGYRAATAPLPGGGNASGRACTEEEKQVQTVVRRNQVQVSVFNAGDRAGLAGSTLEKVEDAGFRGGNSGNAPESARVKFAVVWTTKPDDTAARLVALSFGRRTPVRVVTEDLGPGVDVLVGNRFRELDGKAVRRLKLPAPVETCIKTS